MKSPVLSLLIVCGTMLAAPVPAARGRDDRRGRPDRRRSRGARRRGGGEARSRPRAVRRRARAGHLLAALHRTVFERADQAPDRRVVRRRRPAERRAACRGHGADSALRGPLEPGGLPSPDRSPRSRRRDPDGSIGGAPLLRPVGNGRRDAGVFRRASVPARPARRARAGRRGGVRGEPAHPRRSRRGARAATRPRRCGKASRARSSRGRSGSSRSCSRADRGRLAYLHDVLSHLDERTLAFALDSSMRDPEERLNRFKRLAGVARRGFVEWDVDGGAVRPAAQRARRVLRAPAGRRQRRPGRVVVAGVLAARVRRRRRGHAAGAVERQRGVDGGVLPRPPQPRTRAAHRCLRVRAARVSSRGAGRGGRGSRRHGHGRPELRRVSRPHAHARAHGHPRAGDLRRRRAAGRAADRPRSIARIDRARAVPGRAGAALAPHARADDRRRDGRTSRARSRRLSPHRRQIQRRHRGVAGRAGAAGGDDDAIGVQCRRQSAAQGRRQSAAP